MNENIDNDVDKNAADTHNPQEELKARAVTAAGG